MREVGRNIAAANQMRQQWGGFTSPRGMRGIAGGFKHGGRVHRTGVYKLHRGEHVIPARGKRRGRR